MPHLDIKHYLHFPKDVAFYVPISHFFLLFGYKLFSLYYPLFLIERNFTMSQIGYAYLLIYATIAFTCPILKKLFVNKDARKILQFSFLGYALYSFGMLVSKSVVEILIWQIFLGICSSSFYIASRYMLAKKVSERGFSYFYAMPFLASFLAPLVGGLIFVISGFKFVFVLSTIIQLIGFVAINFLIKEKFYIKSKECDYFLLKKIILNNSSIVTLFALSLIAIGVYRSFFVVFLKEDLNITKKNIVLLITASSFILSLISFKTSKIIRRIENYHVILACCIIGATSLAFSILKNLLLIIPLFLIENFGRWLAETAKSVFLAKNVYDKELAATFDTFITSLSVAMGSVLAGMLLNFISMRMLFATVGFMLLFPSLIVTLSYIGRNWTNYLEEIYLLRNHIIR